MNYIYFIMSQIGGVVNCIINPTDPDNKDYVCSEAEFVKDTINLWYFLPALMLIYVPLVFIRDMRKLAWSHLLSNILIFVVLFIVIGYSTDNVIKEGPTLNPFATAKAYKAISYAAGSFEGIAVLMPLRLVVKD